MGEFVESKFWKTVNYNLMELITNHCRNNCKHQVNILVVLENSKTYCWKAYAPDA